MKKILVFIFWPGILFAQVFTEVSQLPDFYSADPTAIFYNADIDNDGDQDLVMVDPDGYAKFMFFFNTGNGNFVESRPPIIYPFNAAKLNFADLDNDGDQDFVFHASRPTDGSVAELYLNDGKGNFTKAISDMFEAFTNKWIYKLADIDGDNDLDAIVGGFINSDYLTLLYRNINTEYFEVTDTFFSPIHQTQLLFFDADADGDEDLYVHDSVYKNDGSGNYSFSQQLSTQVDVAYDFDFDGDNDLLITGIRDDSVTAFVNDGTGNFNELVETPFGDIFGIRYSANMITEDVNEDGYKDAVFINWLGNMLVYNISIYLNDQNTSYANMTTPSFISFSSLSFFDVNNNGRKDLFFSGYFKPGPDPILAGPRIFYNINNESFAEPKGLQIDGMTDGKIAFADLDNDQDEDFIIAGVSTYQGPDTKMYLNDGFGNFEISPNSFFYNETSVVELADVDGDNDMDAMLSNGLYINDGRGNFSFDLNFPFKDTFDGISFSDIDLDGDQDLLGTEYLATEFSPYAMLFENDGKGNFNKIDSSYIVNTYDTNINFAHFNNDGYEDILITGGSRFYGHVTKVYINKGNKVFEEKITPVFNRNLVKCSAVTDLDGDGDNDLVLGYLEEGIIFYINDGQANFQLSENNSFSDTFYREIFFEDVDDDADQDMLLSDSDNTYLYLNDGLRNFAPSFNDSLNNFRLSAAGFSDIDNDGDKDLLVTGREMFDREVRVSRLFKNGTYQVVPAVGGFDCE